MPGLAKALRRRRAEKYPPKLDAIFDWHTPGAIALFTNQETGLPGLHFIVTCADERFAEYRDAVERATEARLRVADEVFALDLFDEHGPIGRLTASPALAMFFAALDVGKHRECHLLMTHAGEGEDLFIPLPVAVERIELPDMHGEPVEIGDGEHLVITMSQHDATLYVHRFRNRSEAEAQLARNREANEPFVGAMLD